MVQSLIWKQVSLELPVESWSRLRFCLGGHSRGQGQRWRTPWSLSAFWCSFIYTWNLKTDKHVCRISASFAQSGTNKRLDSCSFDRNGILSFFSLANSLDFCRKSLLSLYDYVEFFVVVVLFRQATVPSLMPWSHFVWTLRPACLVDSLTLRYGRSTVKAGINGVWMFQSNCLALTFRYEWSTVRAGLNVVWMC